MKDARKAAARQTAGDARFLAAGAARMGGTLLKNAVKTVIGRVPRLPPRDVFFRAYALHALGLRRIERITCRGAACEGGASQGLSVMYAIAFARAFGLTYLHTPFTVIAHSDRPMDDWARTWEHTLNLGLGEPPADPRDRWLLDFNDHGYDLSARLGMKLTRRHFEALVPEFRRRYYHDKIRRRNAVLTIGVHIRRGDVGPGHPMWMDAEEVARRIRLVSGALTGLGTAFTLQVHSQGGREDFAPLKDWDPDWCLDRDPLWTLRELIEADVLIMGRGAFSYIAGLLSDGIVICDPDKTQMPSWIALGSSGGLNNPLFAERLRACGPGRAEG